MRLNEIRDAAIAVDARGVLEVGPARVLVPLAKAHQRLVRPGIVVVDRNLDDARRPAWSLFAAAIRDA